MIINMSYAVQGWYKAENLLNQGAADINRGNIIDGYVKMTQAVRSAEANLTVLKVEDELMGTALDLFG